MTSDIAKKMSESADRKCFRLSRRLSVEITAGPSGIVVEWCPDVPERLTAKELRRYRQARHEMLTRLADQLGTTVVVVDA